MQLTFYGKKIKKITFKTYSYCDSPPKGTFFLYLENVPFSSAKSTITPQEHTYPPLKAYSQPSSCLITLTTFPHAHRSHKKTHSLLASFHKTHSTSSPLQPSTHHNNTQHLSPKYPSPTHPLPSQVCPASSPHSQTKAPTIHSHTPHSPPHALTSPISQYTQSTPTRAHLPPLKAHLHPPHA